MEKLREILAENWPDVDFSSENALIDDGVLTSLDVVALVSELNDAYDIEITAEDLLPENFNSAKALWAMVEKLQDE